MDIDHKKGFTLTELMITVVIIGIVAGFAIPNYRKSVERSHQRDAENQLRSLHAANMIFRASNNSFVVGNNLNLAAINAALNINLVGNGMTYNYDSAAGVTFTATATRDGGGVTVQITEGALSATNPQCTANCP